MAKEKDIKKDTPKKRDKNANLTPFTSEYQPEHNGRKPSMLKEYITDNGVSIQDVRLVIKNIIMENTKEQLEVIAKDEKKPMLMRVLIGAYLKDFENGSIYNLNSLLDRVYGRAEQPVGITGDLTTYTPKQRAEKIAELEKLKNAIK